METKKEYEAFLSFFNSKFPKAWQGDFSQDANSLLNEILESLIKACKPGNIDTFLLMETNSKIIPLLTVYHPTKKTQTLFFTILLRVLLEEDNLDDDVKILLMATLVALKFEKSEIRVNWRSVKSVISGMIYNTGYQSAFGQGTTDETKSLIVKTFTEKMKSAYPEESVSEILEDLHQGITPNF
jgi:hypothetical protein